MATSLMTDLVLHGLGYRLEVRRTGATAGQLAESMNVAWSWCLASCSADDGPEGLRRPSPWRCAWMTRPTSPSV